MRYDEIKIDLITPSQPFTMRLADLYSSVGDDVPVEMLDELHKTSMRERQARKVAGTAPSYTGITTFLDGHYCLVLCKR